MDIKNFYKKFNISIIWFLKLKMTILYVVGTHGRKM